MPLPDRFETERLRAERLTADHFPELLRMHQDPQVMAHLGGLKDKKQTRAYHDRNLRHWEEHGFGLYIVRERSGDEPIGRALVRRLVVEGADEIEIGYALYPKFWGRGLATEIASACIVLGRDGLGAQTLVGVTLPDNRGSQRVLQKVGMVYEREATLESGPCVLFRIRWRDNQDA